MKTHMLSEKIVLRVGRAEALILFELLADFSGQPTLEIRDEAERLALFRLHGALEETLVEPLKPDYAEIVASSRSLLIQQSGILSA
jgi:hypothetical protein